MFMALGVVNISFNKNKQNCLNRKSYAPAFIRHRIR